MFEKLKQRQEEKIKKSIKSREKEIKERREKEEQSKINEIINYLNDLSDGLILNLIPKDAKFEYSSITMDSLGGKAFIADDLKCNEENFSLLYKMNKEKNEVLFSLKGDYDSNFGKILLVYLTDPSYGYVDVEDFESFMPKKKEIDELLIKANEKTNKKFSKSFDNSENNPTLQKILYSDGRIWTKVYYYLGKSPFVYSHIKNGKETKEKIYRSPV